MNTKFKDFLKKDYVKSGIICFTIAFLSFIYFLVKGEGFFVLTNDFNDQQIPFTIGLHNALLDSGITGFSWDIDLGTSTMDGFSFYELGSPFFWISMLFPANAFPYIVAWLFMLKFSFAGVFSCLYLRRFVNDSKWAVMGSVLYAFSGYSLVNLLFYHFHDAICFFPLLLIGLERYKEKKDYKFFVFTIFLNCFINYFFFVGEVVFLVIYYLCRFASKDIKTMLLDAVKCVGCGILGVGMAAFVFIPNIIFISGNPRTGEFSGFVSMLTTDVQNYLYILKTLLIPGETLTEISAVKSQSFASHGFYLPMVGLGLVFAYIISRKKDWLSKILIYCLVASFIPLLSDLFYMYSAAQMRWWYMLTLMAALATVKMFEEPDVKAIGAGSIIYLALIVVLAVAANHLDMIYNPKRFYILVAVAIFGALLTYLYAALLKNGYRVVFTSLCVFSVVLMTATIHIYRTCAWMDYKDYKMRFEAAVQTELPSSQYRLNDTMNLTSMVAHVAGFSNQSSTDTNSIRDFEDLFDYYAQVTAIPKNDIPGLAELLAGKYFYAFDPNAGVLIKELPTSYKTMYLMERGACPIGFAADSYITEDELRKLDVTQRAIALLDSVVVDKADTTDALYAQVTGDLPEKKAGDIDFETSVSDYVVEHTYGSVLGFEKDGHGMKCVTAYDKDTYVYFSVPYDTGWTATVDGEETDIIVSGGMMMIKVPSGNHNVEFSYITPGLRLGAMVSVACWIVFLVFTFYKRNGKINN